MFDTSLCSSVDPSCDHFRDSSRFEAFDIYDVVYKTVMGVDLMTSIMIPKGLRDVTCSLLVHFHGMLNLVVSPYLVADETDDADQGEVSLWETDFGLVGSRNGSFFIFAFHGTLLIVVQVSPIWCSLEGNHVVSGLSFAS